MSEIQSRLPQRPLVWPDAVLDISDMLLETGFEVYVVGGAVRDAYLHRPVKDLDLVTPVDSIKLGRFIANSVGGAFFMLDQERGVARVLMDTQDGQLVIDVARFRDVDLPGDLLDRDFTFNAMAVDLRGDMKLLIDPLNGENDLRARVIRRCSENSLMDDPIRALRAVRQSVQFDAKIEPQTLSDMRAVAENITDTSPERVRDELFKMMAGKVPARTLRIAGALGLLRRPLPETTVLQVTPYIETSGVDDKWAHSLLTVEKLRMILDTIGPGRTDQTAAVFTLGMIVMALDILRPQLQAHILHQWPEERTHEALLVMGALLHEIGVTVDERVELVAQRAGNLRLSNDEKRRLVTMLRAFAVVNDVDVTDVLSMHRFWRAYGVAGVDACLLAIADMLATAGVALNQDAWLNYLERMQVLLSAYFKRYEEIVEPPILLDGATLIEALDLAPGRIVGELLDMIREAQVIGHVTSQEEALELAVDYLRQQS